MKIEKITNGVKLETQNGLIFLNNNVRLSSKNGDYVVFTSKENPYVNDGYEFKFNSVTHTNDGSGEIEFTGTKDKLINDVNLFFSTDTSSSSGGGQIDTTDLINAIKEDRNNLYLIQNFASDYETIITIDKTTENGTIVHTGTIDGMTLSVTETITNTEEGNNNITTITHS